MRISATKSRLIAAAAVAAFALGSTPALAGEPEEQVWFSYKTITFTYNELLTYLLFRG